MACKKSSTRNALGVPGRDRMQTVINPSRCLAGFEQLQKNEHHCGLHYLQLLKLLRHFNL